MLWITVSDIKLISLFWNDQVSTQWHDDWRSIAPIILMFMLVDKRWPLNHLKYGDLSNIYVVVVNSVNWSQWCHWKYVMLIETLMKILISFHLHHFTLGWPSIVITTSWSPVTNVYGIRCGMRLNDNNMTRAFNFQWFLMYVKCWETKVINGDIHTSL